MGTYNVLNSPAKKGTRLTPIVGVVRRFKSRNAYYASQSDDPLSPKIVLACAMCGQVADADGLRMFQGLHRTLTRRAFSPRTAVMEVLGVCAHCGESNRNARP
jgi:Fur family transcriptional regulator, zinc uptake regulator